MGGRGAPLRIAPKKSIALQSAHQESASVVPGVDRSSTGVPAVPTEEVLGTAAPMGEQIEGAHSGRAADMARPGAAMTSQIETVASATPVTNVARPGTAVTL